MNKKTIESLLFIAKENADQIFVKYQRTVFSYSNLTILFAMGSLFFCLAFTINVIPLSNLSFALLLTTTTSTQQQQSFNHVNYNVVSYFTRWSDPTENAFTLLVPKHWIVQPYLGFNSGVVRIFNGLNNVDFIFNITDPNFRDQIFFANSALYYSESNPALGLNEGTIYPGSNSNVPNVYYYRNATDYTKEFILSFSILLLTLKR